jgi:hypothetical protein
MKKDTTYLIALVGSVGDANVELASQMFQTLRSAKIFAEGFAGSKKIKQVIILKVVAVLGDGK